MPKLKVGFIGVGDHMVRSHIVPLSKDDRVELVAACDLNPAALALVRRRFGIRETTSDRAALLSMPIDAVMIGTPDRLHAQDLYASVLAGKHVMVEKPLADSVNSYGVMEQALDLARAKSLVVSSCHPRRLDPPFLWVKSRLGKLSRDLGPVLHLRFDFSYHRPSETKGGLHTGLLMDHVNHEVDLMNWLFGHASFNATKLHDDQTRYEVVGIRADKITFNFSGTRMLESRIYPEFMVIRFARGELSLNTATGDAFVRFHDAGDGSKEGKIRWFRCGKTNYARRFKATNANFVDAVLNGQSSYLSEEDLAVNTLSGIELTRRGFFKYQIIGAS